ncbi:hypothetical protein D3C72_1201180 [compost metagenome]
MASATGTKPSDCTRNMAEPVLTIWPEPTLTRLPDPTLTSEAGKLKTPSTSTRGLAWVWLVPTAEGVALR